MKKLWLIPVFFMTLTLTMNAQNIENSAEKESLIRTNSELSYKMLENHQRLRKYDVLLEEKQKGNIEDRSLVLGVSVVPLIDYQKTNRDSKFGYLMRHPTSKNQIGTYVSEAVIHTFQVGATATINDWISFSGELLYDPQQSFGDGTITDITRNGVTLRKAMALFGNLDRFPLYLSIGKLDGNFGDEGSVNPFSNSSNWHVFSPLSYGALVGFKKHGLSASFMAIQGGSQFRAAHVDVKGTNVPSRVNNFSADLNYTFHFRSNSSLQLGGSYIHGSAYCTSFPIQHFGEPEEINPAYALYGNLMLGDRILIKGDYGKTLKVWPGSHNPNPPLDQYAASKVTCFTTGIRVNLNPEARIKYALTGEFSKYITGPSGAPWERQNQKILGLVARVMPGSELFAEFFNLDGFVPLNFMTGGNFDDPGEAISERDAYSNGLVLGARLTF